MSKGNQIYDLAERTEEFGKNIIDFVFKLQKNVINNVLVKQIVRSGTSIGANYMEADGASSKRDFIYKIALCRKESKETTYWLKMILHKNKLFKEDCERLIDESHQLSKIFSAIINKTKSNI